MLGILGGHSTSRSSASAIAALVAITAGAAGPATAASSEIFWVASLRLHDITFLPASGHVHQQWHGPAADTVF
jgi:hypothetical protein